MSRLFTCAALIPGFIAMCARHGMSLDKVYAELGYTARDFDAPFVGISVIELNRLFDKLAVDSKTPVFFIELGEHILFESLGVVGQAMMTAKTMRESIEQFNEFRDIIHPLAGFNIRDLDSGQTCIEYQPDSDYAFALDAKYQDVLMTALARMMYTLHGGNTPVISVAFTYPKPDYVDRYRLGFGKSIDILFNQPRCALTLPTVKLDCTLQGSSPEFNQAFVERARHLLETLPSDDRITSKVISVIEQKIGYEVFNIQDVARSLSMTSRTLQRRLKQEGTTYAQLRDSVRFHYAVESLRSSSVDMATLAASLGFSEPANFYAAFRRWQGISPGEYRKRFLDNHPH